MGTAVCAVSSVLQKGGPGSCARAPRAAACSPRLWSLQERRPLVQHRLPSAFHGNERMAANEMTVLRHWYFP